jgi:hypothetical protein
MNLFEKYSYKQKNFGLLLLFVLLIAASYKRSFKTSFELIEHKNELKQDYTEALNSMNRIKLLQAEISNLNKFLGKENVPIEKVQQGFLNFFALKSRHLSVQQIEEVYTFQHPDFSINTFRIDLIGDYLLTLEFLNKLEQNFELARLIHVKQETKKNRKTEQNELHTTILLQNYVRNNGSQTNTTS